ncbi:hypothetical protein SDC9_53442 [bioreactor metagenome]|uniref:Uncharacterized protein n=1 Tax=bioreactor metagenome TaxID=1076179 RepID=A0A644WT78_9ZZZZ
MNPNINDKKVVPKTNIKVFISILVKLGSERILLKLFNPIKLFSVVNIPALKKLCETDDKKGYSTIREKTIRAGSTNRKPN